MRMSGVVGSWVALWLAVSTSYAEVLDGNGVIVINRQEAKVESAVYRVSGQKIRKYILDFKSSFSAEYELKTPPTITGIEETDRVRFERLWNVEDHPAALASALEGKGRVLVVVEQLDSQPIKILHGTVSRWQMVQSLSEAFDASRAKEVSARKEQQTAPTDMTEQQVGQNLRMPPHVDEQPRMAKKSAPQQLWNKVYGEESNSRAAHINKRVTSSPTPEGGCVIADLQEHANGFGVDAYLYKLDPGGKVVWDRTFVRGATTQPNAVVATKDGGYVVAGMLAPLPEGSGDYQAWVLRLDGQGNPIWEKTFGNSDGRRDEAQSIFETSDGGFIVAGYKDSDTTKGESDLGSSWIFKLDSRGSMEWEKRFAFSPSQHELFGIIQTKDGGFAGIHTVYPFRTRESQVHVYRLDAAGQLLWTKRYGDRQWNNLKSILETPDGDLLVSGYKSTGPIEDKPGPSQYEAWILRLDKGGTVQWDKTFGPKDARYSSAKGLFIDNRGEIVVTGIQMGRKDMGWVASLDRNGNVTWEDFFGGGVSDEPAGILKAGNDGFFVVGETMIVNLSTSRPGARATNRTRVVKFNFPQP